MNFRVHEQTIWVLEICFEKSIRTLVFQWISVNKTNAIRWIVLSFFRTTLAWFSLRHMHNNSEDAHSISRTKGTVLVFILMSSESAATCCKHKPRDLELYRSMSESPPFCFTVWRRYRAEVKAIIHSAHGIPTCLCCGRFHKRYVHMCLWCRSENQALSFIDLYCSLRKNYPSELRLLERVMASLLNLMRNFNGSKDRSTPRKDIHVRCTTRLNIPTLS